jgi:hypothetical protein
MTREEVGALLVGVRIVWPHSHLGSPPDRVVSTWQTFLATYDAGEVRDAVSELALSGRDHAPGPGLVARTAAERRSDAPDFDEAWREVGELVRRRGLSRPPLPRHFSHPAVAAFAIPAWRELCQGPAEGTSGYGTHYAQQREAYRALRVRGERAHALEAARVPRRRQLERLRTRPMLEAAAVDAGVPLRVVDGAA